MSRMLKSLLNIQYVGVLHVMKDTDFLHSAQSMPDDNIWLVPI